MINEVSFGQRRDQRRPRWEEKCEKSFYWGTYGRDESWYPHHEQEKASKNSKKSFFPHVNGSDKRVTWDDTMSQKGKNEKSSNSQAGQNIGNNTSILKGSYTQIMVNPTQLSEHEFTNWMEKLMEAHKNRQERKECLYRSYRKPYNSAEQGYKTSTTEKQTTSSTGTRCAEHNNCLQLQL